MSERTAKQAAIKRASAQARANMNRFDRETLDALTALYKQAVADLQAQVRDFAGADGSVRLEVMQQLLAQAQSRLAQLEQARNSLLDAGLTTAATLGVEAFAVDVASIGSPLTRIAHEAVQTVVHFIAEDGLQLSDRIWRLDNGARQAVADAIQQGVIQGYSASQAAAEFLSRGEAVPGNVVAKQGAASAERMGRSIASSVLRDENGAYQKALRVFRTELNRAHGIAYQAAAFEHPDVIGTRFLLSPHHPRTDICDMHARVNRYGLGPGVYPNGKSPWPAHPNTLSYTEVVFADEVAAHDRDGKEDRISFLRAEPPQVAVDVLGAAKAGALRAGLLKESEINTPWNLLKQKYEKRGLLA